MLGLCTHEPHFALLREEVKFGRQKNRNGKQRQFYSFIYPFEKLQLVYNCQITIYLGLKRSKFS